MLRFDVAGWLSLVTGALAALGTFGALYSLSPWGRHYPFYQLDALVRHVAYFGPLLLVSWLAFIPSKQKRILVLPIVACTLFFILPFAVALLPELLRNPGNQPAGPDLEHLSPIQRPSVCLPPTPRLG